MGGLASSAVYLATSLASGPPPLVPPDPIPAAIEAASAPAPRGYVIIDLPRSETVPVLGSVVADAVRLTVERPASAISPRPEPDTGIETEVIASHEQRIGVLRAHIDALRRDKAEAAVLAGLDVRLKRAEAARKLAVARAALARCADACGPQPVLAARPAPRPKQAALPVRAVPVSHSVDRATDPRAFGVTPRPVASPELRALEDMSRPRSGALSLGASVQPDAAPLGHARLLLAKARAALTNDVRERREITLAGLWQWEGSESWSLTAGPQRIA